MSCLGEGDMLGGRWISKQAYERAKRDLDETRSAIREQGRIIRLAIESGGGTHDNAMYDAATHEQEVLFERERKLSEHLSGARLIEEAEGRKEDQVHIGCAVVVYVEEKEKEFEYVILGPMDVEYQTVDNVISYNAPVARALLGKKVGDVVLVNIPAGKRELEICRIRKYL